MSRFMFLYNMTHLYKRLLRNFNSTKHFWKIGESHHSIYFRWREIIRVSSEMRRFRKQLFREKWRNDVQEAPSGKTCSKNRKIQRQSRKIRRESGRGAISRPVLDGRSRTTHMFGARFSQQSIKFDLKTIQVYDFCIYNNNWGYISCRCVWIFDWLCTLVVMFRCWTLYLSWGNLKVCFFLYNM